MPVERMRHIRQSPHLVNEVHRLLRREIRRHPAGDEQADDLALQSLDLLTGDGELWRHAHEVERSFDRVVISQREAVETAFARTVEQLLERAAPIVRKVGVEMKIDAEHPRFRARLLSAFARESARTAESLAQGRD